jgi:CIC family chloride channel protein
MSLAETFNRCPVEVRGAFIGASVGTGASFLPDLVGGGDAITQNIASGGATASLLLMAFLFRFALGAVSYAASVPGGLFAPMLTLGAQLGLGLGQLYALALPGLGIDPTAFAVAGMAALFAGVVQAPVTAIVLVIEMTASFTMLLPMLAATTAAMLMAILLHGNPIYDALRERVRNRAPDTQERRH